MFLARGSPDIDWDEFLTAYSSAVAMNSLRSYIFGSLQVKMQRDRVPDLATLFKNNGAPSKLLSSNELKTVMEKLSI